MVDFVARKKLHNGVVWTYYFALVFSLMDRIVDIKPVEIFCDLFGVHWISFPTYDILMMFKTFLQLLKLQLQLILNLKHLNQDIPVLSRQRKADAKRAKFDTIVK